MSVRMFRARIKPEHVAEAEQAAQELFAAIAAAEPEGVRYAWNKLPDGETFVLVVHLDDDRANPLLGLPEFKDVMDRLKTQWVAEPLTVEPLTRIASYRLF